MSPPFETPYKGRCGGSSKSAREVCRLKMSGFARSTRRHTSVLSLIQIFSLSTKRSASLRAFQASRMPIFLLFLWTNYCHVSILQRLLFCRNRHQNMFWQKGKIPSAQTSHGFCCRNPRPFGMGKLFVCMHPHGALIPKRVSARTLNEGGKVQRPGRNTRGVCDQKGPEP